MKIFTWRANGDGINPFGNSLVEDCFIRSIWFFAEIAKPNIPRTQDDSIYVDGHGIRWWWLSSPSSLKSNPGALCFGTMPTVQLSSSLHSDQRSWRNIRWLSRIARLVFLCFFEKIREKKWKISKKGEGKISKNMTYIQTNIHFTIIYIPLDVIDMNWHLLSKSELSSKTFSGRLRSSHLASLVGWVRKDPFELTRSTVGNHVKVSS